MKFWLSVLLVSPIVGALGWNFWCHAALGFLVALAHFIGLFARKARPSTNIIGICFGLIYGGAFRLLQVGTEYFYNDILKFGNTWAELATLTICGLISVWCGWIWFWNHLNRQVREAFVRKEG